MANGYSGYTNYETWTVALFIDNESNECIKDAVRSALQDSYGDALKEYVEEYFLGDNDSYNLFVQQMLGAAMSEVNWKELHDLYAEQASEWGLGDDEDDEDDEA
jgi:hypothetical protein